MNIDKYIAKLAVEAYNAQGIGGAFDPLDFQVKKLPKNHTNKVIYEISTIREDDYFRLILFCNLGPAIRVLPYELVTDVSLGNNRESNVWVADCTLTNEFLTLDNNVVRRGFYTSLLTDPPVDVLGYENYVEVGSEGLDLFGVE